MKNLSPLIQEFISEFQIAKSEVRELYSKFPSDDFNKKPAPGKWCAVECLEHLKYDETRGQDKIKNNESFFERL